MRDGVRLQPYSFTIKYRPGIENIADYISRHPLDENQKSQEEDLAERYVNLAERYVNFITETCELLIWILCVKKLRNVQLYKEHFFTQEVGSGTNCILMILKTLP